MHGDMAEWDTVYATGMSWFGEGEGQSLMRERAALVERCSVNQICLIDCKLSGFLQKNKQL